VKHSWSWGPRTPDDEPSVWLLLVGVAMLLGSLAFIDSFASQADIGAEPRSDVVWSERELER
jgi:hypothetical protein